MMNLYWPTVYVEIMEIIWKIKDIFSSWKLFYNNIWINYNIIEYNELMILFNLKKFLIKIAKIIIY